MFQFSALLIISLISLEVTENFPNIKESNKIYCENGKQQLIQNIYFFISHI